MNPILFYIFHLNFLYNRNRIESRTKDFLIEPKISASIFRNDTIYCRFANYRIFNPVFFFFTKYIMPADIDLKLEKKN